MVATADLPVAIVLLEVTTAVTGETAIEREGARADSVANAPAAGRVAAPVTEVDRTKVVATIGATEGHAAHE